MAINDPPIQAKPVDENNGWFPQVWLEWFQNVTDCIADILTRVTAVEGDASDTQTALEGMVYWFDDNDVTTGVTAISHTGGATNTFLTNDGAGSFSGSYNPQSKDALWNTADQEFDFSSLKIGDVVNIRIDLDVTTANNNEEFDIVFDFSIGGAPYTLNMGSFYYKTAGQHHVVVNQEFYIGSADARDNPAKLRYVSTYNATIRVNGWYTRVIVV